MTANSIRLRCCALALALMLTLCGAPALAQRTAPYALANLETSCYLGDLHDNGMMLESSLTLQGTDYVMNTLSLFGDSNSAPASYELYPDGRYQRLRGTLVVVKMDAEDHGALNLYADDQLVFSQAGITDGFQPLDFDVDIGLCDTLRFEVLTTGNGMGWLNTKLGLADCILYNDGAVPVNTATPAAEPYEGEGEPLASLPVFDEQAAYFPSGTQSDARGNEYEGALRIGTGEQVTTELKACCGYAEFLLGGAYSTLYGAAVCANSMDADETLTVMVYGDGRLLYQSGLLQKRDKAVPFALDVTGVDSLVFYNFSDLDDGNVALIVNGKLVP